jgi:hypothetical protein
MKTGLYEVKSCYVMAACTRDVSCESKYKGCSAFQGYVARQRTAARKLFKKLLLCLDFPLPSVVGQDVTAFWLCEL